MASLDPKPSNKSPSHREAGPALAGAKESTTRSSAPEHAHAHSAACDHAHEHAHHDHDEHAHHDHDEHAHHDHPHIEAPSPGFSKAEQKQAQRLRWVLATVSSFFVVEFAGARLAKSAALEADALHLLMDIFALGMSLWAMRLSVRPPVGKFTFGLRRAEPLAALLNAILILVTTVEIVHESIGHLRGDESPRGSIMLGVAMMALVVNSVSAWLLHGAMGHKHHGHEHEHDHGHDHGHDHDRAPEITHDPEEHAVRGHQLNLRGAWLHLMGDILGSLAALLAAFVVKLGGPTWVDPAASLLVVVILVVGALRLIRDALSVLLEAAPAHLPVEEVRAALMTVDNVHRVEDLHVWALGAGQDAVMARVVTRVADATAGARAAAHIKETFELAWVAVQADPP